MVVDDEEALRMLVRTLLLKQGHEVTEVESCGALRKAFGGPPPDLVLLDLMLPDGNTIHLLPDLKSAWPRTKVIILTGHATVDAVESAYRNADVLWLNKPFDASVLTAMVELALAS